MATAPVPAGASAPASLRLRGIGASPGCVLGRARVRQHANTEIVRRQVPAGQVEAELQRLRAAVEAARAEMQALRGRLQGALAGEQAGEFLDLHALLLDDPELLYGLDELVREHRYSAEYALRVQRDRLAAVFEQMDDAYLRSRMDDLDHVIERIGAFLLARPPDAQGLAGEILVCATLAPSELAQLQAQGVAGVVATAGSPLSHSAILARSLHLPLVVGAHDALRRIREGMPVIVDGDSGEVIADPGPQDLRDYRARLREQTRHRRELRRLRDKPSRSRDGVDIVLQANAESREDIARAHALGADGLGLYRTEFLFLQRDGLPDEDEQFQAYRDAVLGMDGRSVTFRTLDLGADKADRAGLVASGEANPALGLRGLRLSLAHPRLFDSQLRALLRASGYGPVRILLPMVTTRAEILSVRRRLRRLQRQLAAEGHEVAAQVPLGAMIEVPAAALAVADFVDAVDFLSIGTNDLVQYLLAADRDNAAMARLYSPLEPAVVRLLAQVIATGKAHGRSVAVCGEIAGDPRLAPLLLAIGLTAFSLHPDGLLALRQQLRRTDLAALQARAPALLQARDRRAVERWLQALPSP